MADTELEAEIDDPLPLRKAYDMAWRPIASAPKNGAVVEVGSASTLLPREPDQPPILYLVQAKYEKGLWLSRFDEGGWRPFEPQPTHWRPLQ